KPDPALRNVAIVGLNDEAEAFIRFLGRARSPKYRAVAVVDTARKYAGGHLRGVPIVGTGKSLDRQLKKLCGDENLHGIILSHGRLGHEATRYFLDYAVANGLRVYRFPDRMPHPYEDRKLLENLRVQDLLPGEPVAVDMAGITQLLQDNTVLVTGCGGTIGWALV